GLPHPLPGRQTEMAPREQRELPGRAGETGRPSDSRRARAGARPVSEVDGGAAPVGVGEPPRPAAVQSSVACGPRLGGGYLRFTGWPRPPRSWATVPSGWWVARYSDGKTAIQWIPVSYTVGKSKG